MVKKCIVFGPSFCRNNRNEFSLHLPAIKGKLFLSYHDSILQAQSLPYSIMLTKIPLMNIKTQYGIYATI